MGKGEYLRDQAVCLGLCDEWFRAWPDGLDDEGLADRYLRGIDFSIQHDWPDKGYINEHFSVEFLHSRGIYVDECVKLSDGDKCLDKNVLLGGCTGEIVFRGFAVTCLYVRHSSDITVVANDFANVRIFCYDNSKVHVVGDSAHHVYVYSYDDAFVRGDGNVIIRQRGYHDEL